MYYHFDYHGGPVSYEWMPSTSFERTWEQMCMAYDYGVRDVWIVNAGDLKFNEVPLAYFMELAYDFEKWGTNSPNSIGKYTDMWSKKTFPSADENVRKKLAEVLHGYIRLNAARRPEALNANIYHPCHYLETDRMLELAAKLEYVNEEVYSSLGGNGKEAYYSMIYFPAAVSINLLRMHLYSAKNIHFSRQGKKIANEFAALVTECIEYDRDFFRAFAEFKGGKWKGMELEEHIGFVTWNDDNCRYPLRVQVEPFHIPRMLVTRKDSRKVYHKTYGKPMTIMVPDFLYEGNSEVILEIANDGVGSINYVIEADKECDWLEISAPKGTVSFQEEVTLRCKREKLTDEIQSVRLLIKDSATVVAVEIKAKANNTKTLPIMTFLENNGVIVIEAGHFYDKKDTAAGGFIKLENYGRSGTGMKVFPVTANFKSAGEKPSLTYRFLTEEAGEHIVEIWMTPTNPVKIKSPLRFLLKDSKGSAQEITAVNADYNAGSNSDRQWCQGVLDNIRISKAILVLEKGLQEITIEALDANLILERLLIYRKSHEPLSSYLGPPESFYVK
jgi:hypothetical protein